MRELLRDAPVPEKREGRTPKYPFRDMKVGDSFLVYADEINTVRNAASRYRERHLPWAFAFGKDDAGRWRLWRIPGKPRRVPKKVLQRRQSRL